MKPQMNDNSNVRNSIKFLKNRKRQGIYNNLLINPDFKVPQRPSNSGVFDGSGPYNSDGDYIHDCWQILAAGADTADFSYDSTWRGLKAAVQTSARFGIIQKIESFESLYLSGEKASFSFRTKADYNTNIRCALLSWDGAADTITNDIVSAWAATPTWIANVTAENDDTEDFSVSQTERIVIVDNIDVDTSGMNNLMVMIWTPNAEPIGQNIYIKNCNLNEGKFACTYEPRFYDKELSLCKRYYEQVGFGMKALCRTNPANYLIGGSFYFHTKRTTSPTITIDSSGWSVMEEGSNVNQQASYTKQIYANAHGEGAYIQAYKAIGGAQPSYIAGTFLVDDAL